MRTAAVFQLAVAAALVVPAGLALAARLAENETPVVGLVDGRLRDCPDRPNCVCSEQGSIAPLTFEGDPRRAWAELGTLLEEFPRVERVSWTEDHAHVVFRSALFRFPDDVEFRLDAAAGAIHVRSASRIGYSDMGANERRVEALRRRWNGR